MNSPRYSKTEILLGTAFSLAFAALIFFGMKHVRIQRFWKRRQEIMVVFSDVANLSTDAPVRYNGLEIGRVKSMQPIHLDERLIEERFRALKYRDLNNLPIRGDDIKRKIRMLPEAEFDKACRKLLENATMVKLDLEVLAENDPIRYRLDDEIRIVSTVFGDSVVEIISGHGDANQVEHKQFVLGNAGDFFSNILKSMGEMKEIIGGIREVFGDEERANIDKFKQRFQPLNDNVTAVVNTIFERKPVTFERFGQLVQNAQERLGQTGNVLQSLQPSAQEVTDSAQAALKEVKLKAQLAQNEFTDAMRETKKDYQETDDAVRPLMQQLRQGLNEVKTDVYEVRNRVEKIPLRWDAILDPAGSIFTQSEEDIERFGQALKKILYNLKIAGYVAKENKDLMLGNRDVGENAAQSAIDIQRRLNGISRRMTRAPADAVSAARALESDLLADPVIANAEAAAKKLEEVRRPIDELRDQTDGYFLQPWRERKRAAWNGGSGRWTVDGGQ